MGRVFVKQADAVAHTDFVGKTFGDVVAVAGTHVPGITWQELARYNWGTAVPREVNRALSERVGTKVGAVDDNDPTRTAFDPSLGPPGGKIALPKLWTGKLEPNRTNTLKVSQRKPVPAVAIEKLSRWFIPGQACALEFSLEGVAERADKVDVEIHVAGEYYEEGKNGARTPCGTQAEADSTHLIQRREWYRVTADRAPAVPLSFTGWSGESEASKGILAKPKSTKDKPTYVSHASAPYTALVRYYKDPKDAKATIRLRPFYPRWDAKNKQFVPASLEVKWDLKDDGGKLTQGLLLVWDRDDKCVYRAALDGNRIQAKKLAIPATCFTTAGIPYRVQVQAHSGEAVEAGLALAVMHTLVKPAHYTKAQFIGFEIQPGTKTGGKVGYLGDTDDKKDIAKRCEVLKDAIRAAATNGSIDPADDVLKIFMAPEFYFRGAKGGYPLERISEIMDEMRLETNLATYADWLFVFGTAIGYLEHSVGGKRITFDRDLKHNAKLIDAGSGDLVSVELKPEVADRLESGLKAGVPWRLVHGKKGADVTGITPIARPASTVPPPASGEPVWLKLALASKLTFSKDPLYLTEPPGAILELGTRNTTEQAIKVRGAPCARMPFSLDLSADVRWTVKQGSQTDEVVYAEAESDEDYWLVLKGTKPFAKGRVELSEPVATEVMNVALVQRGWPAPALAGTGLKSAVVFKEYVSSIDYIRSCGGTGPDFDEADGSGRFVRIGKSSRRVVIPTSGARDLLASHVNAHGGSQTWTDPEGRVHVVGSEVNLSGEGGGSIVTIDNINFGIEICLDHAQHRLASFYQGHAVSGDPKTQVLLIPSWGMSIARGLNPTVANGLVFNVDGARADSVARVRDGKFSCDLHPQISATARSTCPTCAAVELTHLKCPSCGLDFWSPSFACHACGVIANGYVRCKLCGTTHAPPAPATCCGQSELEWERGTGGMPLEPIGSGLSSLSGPVVIPISKRDRYFSWDGAIQVWDVKPIPNPEWV